MKPDYLCSRSPLTKSVFGSPAVFIDIEPLIQSLCGVRHCWDTLDIQAQSEVGQHMSVCWLCATDLIHSQPLVGSGLGKVRTLAFLIMWSSCNCSRAEWVQLKWQWVSGAHCAGSLSSSCDSGAVNSQAGLCNWTTQWGILGEMGMTGKAFLWLSELLWLATMKMRMFF